MKRIITPSRAAKILEEASVLLEDIGIEFSDERMFARIGEKVPCTYSGGRIHLPREKVRIFFEKRKQMLCVSQQHEDRITIGGGWHAWYLCDPLTNIPRPAAYGEAVDMAKLAESLGAGRGPIPVAPEGISPILHTMECERVALFYTRGMGGCLTATAPEEIEILKEMYLAAGRRYLLALEPLISPLRLNPEVMDIYFRWCEDPDIDITVFTPIPMAGATAPLVFPAALVQTLAEALAQDYIFYHLSEGRHQDGFSLRLDPFDMRHMNIAFGSPEWCLLKQAVVELWNELTGGSYTTGSFRTNSRCVDAQAMLERTASFFWQTEMGIRHFSAVGQMSVDEVFSPVQAMLDLELAQYGNRLLKGLDDIWIDDAKTTAAALAGYDLCSVKDVILEGLEGHNYLDAESTLDYFREAYDMSRITDTRNVMTWKAAGMPGFEQEAWERARGRILAHTFELEDSKKREINRLFDRYAARLC